MFEPDDISNEVVSYTVQFVGVDVSEVTIASVVTFKD
jgi:hypothetical protein